MDSIFAFSRKAIIELFEKRPELKNAFVAPIEHVRKKFDWKDWSEDYESVRKNLKKYANPAKMCLEDAEMKSDDVCVRT